MKAHQLARGIWDLHEPATILAQGCRCLRPPAPRVTHNNEANISALDLKSFVRPDPGPRRIGDGRDSNPHHVHSPQVETHLGGTRWNPTQEQIGILEMLYRGGVRTPNAQQIEQITAQLGKYGKIEGKNVFYWFQNHKARERQKQKRGSLADIHFPRTSSVSAVSCGGGEEHINGGDDAPCKRKCRSWGDERKSSNSSCGEEDGSSVALKTLELFPLRPEGRRCAMSEP